MELLRIVSRIALIGTCIIALGVWVGAHQRKVARMRWHERDIVDLNLEDTFPASDPPSWTNTTAG